MTLDMDRPTVLGLGLAVVSAATIALGPNLAKLAYANGADVLAVMIVRGVMMVAICLAILAARGQLRFPSRKVIVMCLASGVSFAAMSYGYFGAVRSIPVGLAVLVYFLHPLLVTGAAHLLGLGRATPRQMIFAMVILAGLGLAVGVDIHGMEPVGLGLAVLAAVAVTAMILLNARVLPHSDPVTVNMLMVSVTTGLLSGWAALPDSGFSLPKTEMGWAATLGVGATFTIGLLSFFYAVQMIGAVRATMVTSLQPLFAILFAAGLLGEMLSPAQMGGAALVILGLMLRDASQLKTRETKLACR